MDRELTPTQRRILDVLRQAVTARGYQPSIREIGDAVGLHSPSSVHSQLSQLEKKGYIRRNPTKSRAIEVVLNDPGSSRSTSKVTVEIPVLGRIAAGGPILADSNIEDYVLLPRDIVGQGELFILRVRGDSMKDVGILDDDMVVVRRQETAENGEIVAAMLEGPGDESEATVKRLSRQAGRVLLLPANDAYEPIDGTEAVIAGKVVTVLRKL